jgi:hypothetical protein
MTAWQFLDQHLCWVTFIIIVSLVIIFDRSGEKHED